MNDIQEFAQQVFASQPFSRFVGAELTATTGDSAELSLTIQDHHLQQHGFVHGGVISYLADNAITFAGGIALGGNALTVEFKINYLRPGVGTRLVASAQARSAGKRMAICQCEIHAEDGETRELCALAQGTVVPAG
ncbi:PaaI family thioesterase [Acidovorax sp. PRC11]|nr:PaaI family thioesterase [Acidovorax sp. PRC11]MDT0140598.1 PaaI family thioesterase [Acidovorax sp. PRC11]